MKVYLKFHVRSGMETVAACDENLLDRVINEDDLQIKISNQFYGGELIQLDKAMEILKQSTNFNIVGEHLINRAIDDKLLPKEGVRSIDGVPMAMKMMF